MRAPACPHTRALTQSQETMKLMLKLRKELNVTSDEHKEWLQELIRARNEGTLSQL